jgi:hypothetical protein
VFAIPLPFALVPIAAVAWFGAVNPTEPEGAGALILVVDEPVSPLDNPVGLGWHASGPDCDPLSAPII